MAVVLSEGQSQIVNTKRLPPEDRPTYYNAALQVRETISADFEAWLILLGPQLSKQTMDWLQKSSSYAVRDADRDSLVNSACQNEIDDATASLDEIKPIIDQFSEFRGKLLVSGFEAIPEVGLLLSDLQAPMAELMNISARLQYRNIAASLIQAHLSENGITLERNTEITSWYGPLTAY